MLNTKQRIFISEYISDCDHIRAYQVAFKTKSKQIARVNGLRLLKRKEIATIVSVKQAAQEKIITETRNKEIAAAARKGILSDLEIEIKLCSIISEEFEYEEILGYKTEMGAKGEPPKLAIIRGKRKPTPAEIKGAADLIFKKRGSYAPLKTDLSINIPVMKWAQE